MSVAWVHQGSTDDFLCFRFSDICFMQTVVSVESLSLLLHILKP